MPEKKQDLIIATVLLAFCGFWAIQAGNIREVSMPGTPGPRYFPYIIIVALAIMAVALAIPALLSLAKVRKTSMLQVQDPAEMAGCVEPEGTKPAQIRVVGVFLAIFGYILAVEQIGFFVATAVASVFMLLVFMGIRNWKMLILSSAVITGGLFVIFRLIIKISLPSGILF